MLNAQSALSQISLLLTLCLRLFALGLARAPIVLARTEAALADAIRATAEAAGLSAPDVEDAALIAWFNATPQIPPACAGEREWTKGDSVSASEYGISVFGRIEAHMCGAIASAAAARSAIFSIVLAQSILRGRRLDSAAQRQALVRAPP